MNKIRARGVRTLAWDVDFGRDLSRMAAARLDATVTDDLQPLLAQRREPVLWIAFLLPDWDYAVGCEIVSVS